MLTPAWFPLKYHPLQAKLWRSQARFVAAAAGRGSGKTELARRRVVRMLPVKKPWHDPMYFYALPTYRQASRVAWRHITRLVPKEWIKGAIHESELRIETIFGSSLYIVGLDKPQRIEGDQWDGGVVDESCDQKPGHFERSILPALSHRNGWCWRIGVPKRAGVGAANFKEFFKAGSIISPEGGYIPAVHESYAWSSEDILTPEQLAWAKANLDAKDYNEQYRANWETVGGAIFYAFDEVLNVQQCIYRRDLPLIIGSDFNVDPMAWVIGQQDPDHPHKELRIIDEIWIRNTNTRETLDALYNRYGKSHTAGFTFMGDASSRSRNTRASESDYMQIRNDRRFSNPQVIYPRANPALANRFATCNAAFCNAEGVRRVVIDPRCKNLIRDLTTRAYKPGTSQPDDEGDIGHITDALGYVIYQLFPITLHIPQAPKVYAI